MGRASATEMITVRASAARPRSSSTRSPAASVGRSATSRYPLRVSRLARRSAVTQPDAVVTVARSNARFTSTSTTPGSRRSALSTRAEQVAHDMPSMGKVRRSVGTSNPVRATTSDSSAASVASSSKDTDARSKARLTLASRTPGASERALSRRDTQALQVIPSIGRSSLTAPARPSAAIRCSQRARGSPTRSAAGSASRAHRGRCCAPGAPGSHPRHGSAPRPAPRR